MLWKNRDRETGLQRHAARWYGGNDTGGWPVPLRSLVLKATDIKAPNDITQGYLKLETTDGLFEVSPGMYISVDDGHISLHHGGAFETLNDWISVSPP
jgi:hypothetical protein